MNKPNRNLLRRAIGLAAALLVISSCHQRQRPAAETQHAAYYTCSMHPQVHQEHPGNCPICGMKLIRVDFTANSGNADVHEIRLTAAQLQLAGITLDTVRRQHIATGTVLTGTVAADESRTAELSARVGGRVVRLYVRATGEKIKVGRPVYAIYSEDLLEAEKEYLLAMQQQRELRDAQVDYPRLVRSAAEKLRLWGLTTTQLRTLAETRQTSASTTVLSTVSGTVTDILVHEGDYVTEGMTMIKTEDLSDVWVEAQAYPGENMALRPQQQLKVSFPDLGRTIAGSLSFVNPELSDHSTVELLRVRVPNPDGLIRPGMLAYVSAQTSQTPVLAVPASAIIPSEGRSKVWVKNADGGFSSRYISARSGGNGLVSVQSGLQPGDIVVDRGAYLLNSEDIFKNGGEHSAMGNMK